MWFQDSFKVKNLGNIANLSDRDLCGIKFPQKAKDTIKGKTFFIDTVPTNILNQIVIVIRMV